MKKIFFLLLVAAMGVIFTSCENETIEVNKIASHREQFYPEPYTNWGGSIDNVKSEMSKYSLTAGDMFQMDAEYTNGQTELKWFLYFYGKNPFDQGNDIVYFYCFDSATSGLCAVQVTLYNIDLSDITAQLEAHGYSYVSYDGQYYYHTYQSNTTSVRVYVPTSQSNNYILMYQKIGANLIKPRVLQ